MVLNMLTTIAMVRVGKTYGNLMVDVQAGSEKLKDRARRIVAIVTGLEYDETDKLLSRAHWNVKAAIVMQKTGLPLAKAQAPPARGEQLGARGHRRGHPTAPARTAPPGAGVVSAPAAARAPTPRKAGVEPASIDSARGRRYPPAFEPAPRCARTRSPSLLA